MGLESFMTRDLENAWIKKEYLKKVNFVAEQKIGGYMDLHKQLSLPKDAQESGVTKVSHYLKQLRFEIVPGELVSTHGAISLVNKFEE